MAPLKQIASDGPIRVAFYCDGHEVGGAEINLSRLVASLSPRIEATVLGTNPDVVELLASQRPGTAAHLLPEVRSRYHLRAIASHAAAIRRTRPDILQISLNRPWGSQHAVLCGLANPRIRVLVVENSPRQPEKRRHLLYRRLTSRFLAGQVALGERSTALVAELAGVPLARITTIPIGVPDLPLEPPPRPAGGPLIGSLARLDPIKGIDVLLRAMTELEGVSAVIVGDGEARVALVALAQDLGVADRVTFAGWSDRARDYLALLDVYVLASRFEGLPVSVIEAMLAGLPVVASDVGGVADAVRDGETGVLVPPEDPAALAAAIRGVLADRDRMRALGQAGRARALERFGAERMAAEFEALYSELTC